MCPPEFSGPLRKLDIWLQKTEEITRTFSPQKISGIQATWKDFSFPPHSQRLKKKKKFTLDVHLWTGAYFGIKISTSYAQTVSSPAID